MLLAVKLADSCRAEAKLQPPATMLAVKKAQGVTKEVLSSFEHLGLLWKCAASCTNPAAFTAVDALFKQMGGNLLGPVLTSISKCVDEASPSNQRTGLATLVAARYQWLVGEIARLSKPFSWEIPDATFPANAGVEQFLRGEQSSFTVRGFGGIVAARKFVSDNTPPYELNPTASYTMSARGSGRNASVEIIKTRKYFDSLRRKIDSMNNELARL
ncbi:hypothetical protein PHYSODRAFT_401044, partial [Phytophthora sojae]